MKSHLPNFAILVLVLLAFHHAPVGAEETVNEAAAIAWVQQRTGKVVRDEKHPDRPVVEVYFRGPYGPKPNFGDEGLGKLLAFPELRRLSLRRSNVSDAGMTVLTRFKKLQALNLTWTKVTDEGVKRLAVIESLRVLDLAGTPITGTAVEAFAGHRQLVHLESRPRNSVMPH